MSLFLSLMTVRTLLFQIDPILHRYLSYLGLQHLGLFLSIMLLQLVLKRITLWYNDQSIALKLILYHLLWSPLYLEMFSKPLKKVIVAEFSGSNLVEFVPRVLHPLEDTGRTILLLVRSRWYVTFLILTELRINKFLGEASVPLINMETNEVCRYRC